MSSILHRADAVIAEARAALAAEEHRLTKHPFIAAVEEARLSREQLRPLAGEQFHIITGDLRSVAHLVTRFGHTTSRDFFIDTLTGERVALNALLAFANAVGMTTSDLERYEPMPAANAYTNYMAFLALYHSDAEVAAAYLVNFPAWGACCGRLSAALRSRYGLSADEVAFFDFFAADNPAFVQSALAVIQRGLDAGVEPRLIARAARLLQGYEVLFWDALWQAVS